MNDHQTTGRRLGALRASILLAGLAAGLVAVSAANPPQETVTATSGTRIQGGKASVEELVSEFLAALAARDRDALHRLRFSETEYREVIYPGAVEVGKPPRKVTQQGSDLAWGLLDTKSAYSEQALLSSHGGRKYRVVEMKFAEGEKDYAGYHAYKQLRLIVQSDDGAEVEIRTGSIGEVDGQYKFFSFIRD
jgi:hypothetical protein